MIIWLASYPKSGNTWVRLFLDNLFSNSENFNINNNFIDQFPLRHHFEGISDNINDLDDGAKKFPIVTKTEKDVVLNAVMSNSFGFGGTNATLIFEKV